MKFEIAFTIVCVGAGMLYLFILFWPLVRAFRRKVK